MATRRTHRILALLGLVAALSVVVLPASGDTPETGTDPNVTLTVTPDDFVANGQTVTVTGTGFPPNTPGIIRQCAGPVTASECDLDVAATFVTGPSGGIPPTAVVVERIIDAGTRTFNCGVFGQECALVATAGGSSSRHHVSVAGAGTLVPTSTLPPGSSTTTSTIVPVFPSLCGALETILGAFPFLRSVLGPLLGLFGCA